MSLEAIFRTDINGWLEYENKRKSTLQPSQQQLQIPNSSLEQLFESLDSTLSYHNYSSESSKALHNTVFYNVMHNQDYAVDFNVVNFPVALNHYILHFVCDRFDLHKYTCHKIWGMPAQDALQFMMETFLVTNKPLRHFQPIFIKLMQKNIQVNGVADQFIFEQIKIDNGVDFVSHHLPSIFQTIYDCILDNAHTAKKTPEQTDFLKKSTDRLISYANEISQIIMKRSVSITDECHGLLQLIFGISGAAPPSNLDEGLRAPTIAIPIQTCRNARIQQYSVKHDWHRLMEQQDANTTVHEQAFLVICWHLRSKRLALNKICQQDENEELGFDRLEEHIRHKVVKIDVAKCQLWCIFSIRNRASFWKSTLKVVVQFMDLWIKVIVDNKCADIFARLIAKENMMIMLYNIISKHVQQYQKSSDQDNLTAAKNLCQMLETCIDNTENVNDIFDLRDYILTQRPETNDFHLPTLGSIELWNIPFERELLKVCNQITAVDDNYQAPQDLVLKLIKLSVVWPYQVIQKLFMACVQNKNQFKIIIPILNMMGNLCVLRKSNSCSSLLMSVIQDSVAYLQESNVLLSHQENITQFIKACLLNHFTEIHPIILTPKCLPPDQPTKMLLNLTEVLNGLILHSLVEFTQHPATFSVQSVQFVLYLLNTFCKDRIPLSHSSWNSAQLYMNESDLPAILYCSPDSFVRCLTSIMDLREQDEKHGIRLEDWEAALTCIDKLTVIIRCGLDSKPSQFRMLQQYFETSLADFGWKSQLLWYPLLRSSSLRVPSALVRITGTLNGIFSIENDETMQQNIGRIEGWRHLFTACKLSTDLTDTLFQQHAQWEYNLLLLWKHPMENEMLENGLQHALHPNFSNSVSIEYPKLLKHFLFKLYDSFDFYTVLQDEQYYADKSIMPIISQLSKFEGTRLYFVVLCTTKLLKTQANDSNPGDLYYMSCLVKVIQDMKQWGNISKEGQSTSYNKLKEKLNQDVTDNESNYCYYYPYLDTEKLKSDRALSILTLYHLCLSAIGMEQSKSDIIERLAMQIIEGLVDMESHQQFERMLQQQPKRRIASWKKKSKSGNNRCKQMRLRPTLANEEVQILKPVVAQQPYNSHHLLQVLGLLMPHNGNQLNDNRILYFL